jgi:hypothetical protein
MGPAMATGTRSEVTAAPAAAQPERTSAGGRDRISSRALPDALLQIQRTAGNAAVARMVARPKTRALQRCGANCGCNTCSTGHAEDEMLEEQFGLLRTAVARRGA